MPPPLPRRRPRSLLLAAATLVVAVAAAVMAIATPAFAQQQQSGRSYSNNNDNNSNNNKTNHNYFFGGGKLPDAAPALRLHNVFRALHVAQPLSWDESLARDAQSWADRCAWRHADASKGEKNRDVGENMYWSLRYDQAESGARAVKAWYREVADVDWRASMDRRPRESGRMVGHATQLLWRSTKKVGCGYSACGKLEGSPAGGGQSDGRSVDFVVCRYWPTGNYVGRMEQEVAPGKLGGPEVGRK